MRARTQKNNTLKKKYNSNDVTIIDFFAIAGIFFFLIFLMFKFNGASKDNEILTQLIFYVLIATYIVLRKKITHLTHSFVKFENPYFLTLLLSPFLYLLSQGIWWLFLTFLSILIFGIITVRTKTKYTFKETKVIIKTNLQQLGNNYNYHKLNENTLLAAEKKIREENHKMKYLMAAGVLSLSMFTGIMIILLPLASIGSKTRSGWLEAILVLLILLGSLVYFIALIAMRIRYGKALHDTKNTLLFHDFRGEDFVYSKSTNARWGYDYVFHKKR